MYGQASFWWQVTCHQFMLKQQQKFGQQKHKWGIFYSNWIHQWSSLRTRRPRFIIRSVEWVRFVFLKSFNSHQNMLAQWLAVHIIFFTFRWSDQCVASNTSSFKTIFTSRLPKWFYDFHEVITSLKKWIDFVHSIEWL